MIGNLAEQGMKGVKAMVKFRSFSFSTVRALMRIAVIGAGASGLYGAIAIKKKHPEAEVTVFEKEAKIGRKLYATGNGHCNLLNAAVADKDFNHPDFLASYLSRYSFAFLKKTLTDWGILTWQEGDYVYPLSYSAPTYVGLLSALAMASAGTIRSLSRIWFCKRQMS